MFRLACAAFLATALVSPLASAKCAMGHLAPKVMTTAPIPAGGGIVVATLDVPYSEADEGDAVQPSWQLDVGDAKSAPKIDTLAPGLAVYRVPAGTGTIKLLDGTKVRATATFAKGDAPAALAAPKLEAVRHDRTYGRRASAFTTVTLDGAPPAGAVALVLADAKGKPRSYGLVEGTGTELRVYAQSRCSVLPNGTIESKMGDKVTLFWVDQSGRKSAPSKVIEITGKTEIDGD